MLLKVLGGSLGVVVVSDAFRRHFESHLGAKMEPKSAFFWSPQASQDGLRHNARFVSYLRRAGIAKMRFSYHRGAIFEHTAGRARGAENAAKMEPNPCKNGTKIIKNVSERTFKKQARNEAFWRPSWDPRGSQDGS